MGRTPGADSPRRTDSRLSQPDPSALRQRRRSKTQPPNPKLRERIKQKRFTSLDEPPHSRGPGKHERKRRAPRPYPTQTTGSGVGCGWLLHSDVVQLHLHAGLVARVQAQARDEAAPAAVLGDGDGVFVPLAVASDGEAWEVGANSVNVRPKGSLLTVPKVGRNGRNFAALGFEIPRKLPDAPPVVILHVWV